MNYRIVIFAKMQIIYKILASLLIVFFSVILLSSCHRHEGASNPYIESKNKPTQEIKDGYAKSMKKQNRAAKKQMKRTRKMLYGK